MQIFLYLSKPKDVRHAAVKIHEGCATSFTLCTLASLTSADFEDFDFSFKKKAIWPKYHSATFGKSTRNQCMTSGTFCWYILNIPFTNFMIFYRRLLHLLYINSIIWQAWWMIEQLYDCTNTFWKKKLLLVLLLLQFCRSLMSSSSSSISPSHSRNPI